MCYHKDQLSLYAQKPLYVHPKPLNGDTKALDGHPKASYGNLKHVTWSEELAMGGRSYTSLVVFKHKSMLSQVIFEVVKGKAQEPVLVYPAFHGYAYALQLWIILNECPERF